MPISRSSGDILADKRFAYADTLLAEGDFAGAADLYAQAAQQAPGWAPAHLALGLALAALGRRDEAAAAFAEAERLDPDGALGAGLHRARLAGEPAGALPDRYVAALFDDYAPRFESHLTEALGYRGPAVILGCLDGLGIPKGPVLDLGCGTGLMARALQPRAAPIDGVDLSPGMVEQARKTALYRTLTVGEGVAVMNSLPAGSYAAVLAADVLVYLGDLRPVADAAARVLAPGGVFAATVQAAGVEDYELGDDLRFRHGAAYLRPVLGGAGFAVPALDPCTTRREAGRDVPGLVFAARAP